MTVERLRIASDVEVLGDDRGQIVLLPTDERPAIRLNASTMPLIRALQQGACKEELISLRARQRSNEAAARVDVDRLVAVLAGGGLLGSGARIAAGRTLRSSRLTRIYDRAALAVVTTVGSLLPGRVWPVLAAVGCGLALLTIIALWCEAGGAIFTLALTPIWWVAAVVLFIAYPALHEFSHAVAARAAGVKVSGVGIDFLERQIRPFTEARRMALITQPHLRFWYPFAGVLFDLTACAAAGTTHLALPRDSAPAQVAGAVFVFLHAQVLLNVGFLPSTDASHAIAAARLCLQRRPADAVALAVRAIYIVFAGGCIITGLITVIFLASPK